MGKLCLGQCDQFGRLIVQYMAIFSNENLHKSKKCLNTFNSLPSTKYTLDDIAKAFEIFSKVANFPTNLVTPILEDSK